jgi:FkbM family methyltransferase
MRNLFIKLIGFKKVRTAIKFLHLHSLGNWWLRRFPVIRTLPGSGIRYRACRGDSVALAVEIFEHGTVYSKANLPASVRTFADLGCNVGFFTCWLCDQFKTTSVKGLMVDANADAVADARWQVAANRLRDVQVLHGLAGTRTETGEATFFLHATNVNSTAVPTDASLQEAFTWKSVQVPCISIEENWRKFFGAEPCDLLKVDIEGSELDFFRNETVFLKRVQTLIVEWHKWKVTLAEVEQVLTAQGFQHKSIVAEDARCGTAVFWRKNNDASGC